MKFLAAVISLATVAVASVPGIPSEATARSLLSELAVAQSVDNGGYSRELFPHWKAVSGEAECTARQVTSLTISGSEYVLRRDGNNVVTGSDCYPTSGSWTCPFDGKTHTVPSQVSIDHLVPLKNAWISGASSWTTTQRQAFANDIKGPQLWAVTTTTNSQKGDKSPDSWKPALTGIHCDYAAAWVQVKSSYSLTVTAAEKSALESMLDSC
ncbi:unnamed protein product [Clonostachys rhizophaga]|uniref:GmrSD restriction endonucleases C-terminal domain-containing protein n=1 Tax=Clonostachys rhizophaga TaxID=160324 RepID=A0A9N9YJ13_9HYPO|nr:unnamed protein product [Clonostachys rhizophaga]